MIDHYNAFISYKHGDVDNRIAAQIQRDLERFHIPHKLQKKTGMKKIERIFRDKDELPITSDLSNEISHALANSDYLIVICSTHTKESQWVPREIEYFLRNHTRQQVLTVLVDGEPQDVVPPILTYEDRLFVDQFGKQQLVRVPLEPLSCDYRMPYKRAKREELPRLASALIGCSYDELMRRRRQYQMRRAAIIGTAVAVAGAAFSGYMAYSRIKIKQSYDAAMINRSKYLANEAFQLLDDEQRIEGLELVMEALPSEKDPNKPVTPEAIRTLSRATLAYTTLTGTNIETSWNYAMPYIIDEFIVSPTNRFIAAHDRAGNIKVWDTNSHEETFGFEGKQNDFEHMIFVDDETIIFWNNTKVDAYSLADGSVKWHTEPDVFITGSEASVIDGFLYMTSSEANIIKFDVASGKLVEKYDLTGILPENETSFPYITEFSLSPDRKNIAAIMGEGWNGSIAVIYNIDSKKATKLEGLKAYVSKIEWYDDKNLMVSATEAVMNSSYRMGNGYFYTPTSTTISCLDPSNGKEKWNYELTTTDVNLSREFLALPEKKCIAFYEANICVMLNIADGSEINLLDLNNSIIDISDNDKNGDPIFITTDGLLSNPSNKEKDTVLSIKHFTNSIAEAEINQGIYVRTELARDIIFYDFYMADENWTRIGNNVTVDSLYNNYILTDEVLASITEKGDDLVMTVINPKTDTVLCQIDLDGGEYGAVGYNMLGSYKDYMYYIDSVTDEAKVMRVDLTSGKTSEYTGCKPYDYGNENTLLKDNLIFYYTTDDEFHDILNIHNLDSGETKSITLPDDAGSPFKPIKASKDNKKVFYSTYNGCYIIDTTDDSVTTVGLPDNWTATQNVVFSKDGKLYALSDDNRTIVKSADNETLCTISAIGSTPTGFAFYEDPLTKKTLILVTYNDGLLNRYDVETGEYIGSTELSVYSTGAGDTEIYFPEHDASSIFIQQGTLFNIIDTSSWIETVYIERCLGYHIPSDHFMTMSYTDSSAMEFGYFKRYTTEELIQKGRDILQGAELNDTLKSQYGIDD